LGLRREGLLELMRRVPASVGRYHFYRGMVALLHARDPEAARRDFAVAAHLSALQESFPGLFGSGWFARARLHEGIALLHGDRAAEALARESRERTAAAGRSQLLSGAGSRERSALEADVHQLVQVAGRGVELLSRLAGAVEWFVTRGGLPERIVRKAMRIARARLAGGSPAVTAAAQPALAAFAGAAASDDGTEVAPGELVHGRRLEQ